MQIWEDFAMNAYKLDALEDNLFEHECWYEFVRLYKKSIEDANQRNRDFIECKDGAKIFEQQKEGI